MKTSTFSFWRRLPNVPAVCLGDEENAIRLVARGDRVHIYILTPNHEHYHPRTKKLPPQTPRGKKTSVKRP